MSEQEKNRRVGTPVKYRTPRTGMTPQTGTIVALRSTPPDIGDIPYAEIAPDDGSSHVFLCERAVWGYEVLAEKERGEK